MRSSRTDDAGRNASIDAASGHPRLLVATAGDAVPAAVIERTVTAIRGTWPRAWVRVLDGRGPWDTAATEQWEWITRLAGEQFDQAIIVGDGEDSPYALAYAFYLAGIPRRSGVSREFGGKLLTRRIDPVGPGRYPAPHDLIETECGKES